MIVILGIEDYNNMQCVQQQDNKIMKTNNKKHDLVFVFIYNNEKMHCKSKCIAQLNVIVYRKRLVVGFTG